MIIVPMKAPALAEWQQGRDSPRRATRSLSLKKTTLPADDVR